jgi:SpoIID/LytB domain protein
VSFALLLLTLTAGAELALADGETSSGDKLRILYSNRFTFTDDGLPLVTIELMSGEPSVDLSAAHGVSVLPDGEGGPSFAGKRDWRVSVEGGAPALIDEWTIVGRFGPDDDAAVTKTLDRWKRRGYKPKRFEIGTLFGVEGAVFDSRRTLVGVAPVRAPRGAARARAIARKHNVATSVHPNMIRRPKGTVVARSGSLVVRNSSVLWFAPTKRTATVTLKNVRVGHGGSSQRTRREDRRYFGSIYVTVGIDGKLVAVNAVAADRLLAGIVPSEMFASAPPEALMAQAIAARTELLQKLGRRHLVHPFLLCSTQQCQVYSGAGREDARTTRAVQKTRGMVLMRSKGGLVDARYSASCGGHSEHNENIWGNTRDSSLRGRFDAVRSTKYARAFTRVTDDNLGAFLALPKTAAWCGQTRFGKRSYRWNKRVAAAEIDRRVAAKYPKVGSVRSITPMTRGVSGRIRRIKIAGSAGTKVVVGDLHIRRLLGGLRSSLFTVSRVGSGASPTAFEFRGAGFGHGVGMCQHGAIGMASHGKKHREILRHYYKNSDVRRLY